MKYVYPAIFTKEETGYSVIFPDVERCYTCGDDLSDAISMAEDVLAFTLYRMERDGKSVPPASDIANVTVTGNQFASYVSCDTIDYQKRNSNRAVKKTLTIPEWLNEEATARGINFSQILQDALRAQLDL